MLRRYQHRSAAANRIGTQTVISRLPVRWMAAKHPRIRDVSLPSNAPNPAYHHSGERLTDESQPHPPTAPPPQPQTSGARAACNRRSPPTNRRPAHGHRRDPHQDHAPASREHAHSAVSPRTFCDSLQERRSWIITARRGVVGEVPGSIFDGRSKKALVNPCFRRSDPRDPDGLLPNPCLNSCKAGSRPAMHSSRGWSVNLASTRSCNLRIGGAPRRAGRDPYSLPHGYHERGAVAGCVHEQHLGAGSVPRDLRAVSPKRSAYAGAGRGQRTRRK